MRILVIDVGGNNIKVLGPGQRQPVKIPSGPEMSAARMARAVKLVAAAWEYDVVTVGYPGPIRNGHPASEPVNLGRGWVRYNYRKAFGKPVRFINDAAMQALGSYEGGRMLYLGLGTGLGTALVIDGVVIPTEMAHLPYRKGRSFEDYVGQRGYERMGRARWIDHVERVVEKLQRALLVDYIVLGGGNVKRLEKLPKGCRLGSNANAFVGGVRVWSLDGVRRARGWTLPRARSAGSGVARGTTRRAMPGVGRHLTAVAS